MKVLIVYAEERSKESLKIFLKTNKIESEEIYFQNCEQLKQDILLVEENCQAVIFDRIYFPLNELMYWLTQRDCFFIIDNYQKIKSFGEIRDDFTLRFYFWPLNYLLLLDDLKSITRLKEYMDFGKIELEDVELNLNRRALVKGKTEVYLRNKEYELLLYLAKNKGKILSRVNILENVWDMNSNVLTNTVDVHISKIRRILEKHFGLAKMIKTIPCSGYILG